MPIVFSSLRSAAYSGLLRASGGARRNCDGRASTHGVIVANCGPAPGAPGELLGNPCGVGRQAPTAPGVPTMPSTPRNGGGAGVIPSVSRQAQMASATVCPQAIPELIDCVFSFEGVRQARHRVVRSVSRFAPDTS